MILFPISRDPPEGGTCMLRRTRRSIADKMFPISRDPPEGGTEYVKSLNDVQLAVSNF